MDDVHSGKPDDCLHTTTRTQKLGEGTRKQVHRPPRKRNRVQRTLLLRPREAGGRRTMERTILCCGSRLGMQVVRSGGYSGWEPNVDSPILKAMKESYKAQFGTEPAVKVIHAGLECGIIGATMPGLDMISFGPTLRSPHSPDERCLIPTVQKFYDFLVATLANAPVKE